MAAAASIRHTVTGKSSGFGPATHGFAPAPPPARETYWLPRVVDWLDRQRQRMVLARLDDRLLADIGVTRAEARDEARRWN
jgi:uncharacterized protein YjiS (DUF1127 family)